MANWTEQSDGNLLARIDNDSNGNNIFQVQHDGGTPLLSVDELGAVRVYGPFERDAPQDIEETSGAADIVSFRSGGVAVAGITKDGLGVLDQGSVRIPAYSNAAGRPATAASGDVILYQPSGLAPQYYLYVWSGAGWVDIYHTP